MEEALGRLHHPAAVPFETRGVQKMNTVLMPYGEAQVRSVKVVLAGYNCDNVAITDDLPQQSAVVRSVLGI